MEGSVEMGMHVPDHHQIQYRRPHWLQKDQARKRRSRGISRERRFLSMSQARSATVPVPPHEAHTSRCVVAPTPQQSRHCASSPTTERRMFS